MFDWIRFFQQHNIVYHSKHRKAARGNVVIDCVFCRERDGFHLGVNVSSGYWGCWKNEQHRGKSPVRLIQALLGCNYGRAREIAGVDAAPDLDSLSSMLSALKGTARRSQPLARLEFPPEIKPLRDSSFGRYFVDYLSRERGYRRRDVDDLVDLYGLRYAARGPFAYRIIFPIYMPAGLVNWTGRSIVAGSGLRYRTLTVDAEKSEKDGTPQALLSVEKTLWNFAELIDAKADVLIVAEGPFDAMRIDWIGRDYGIRATNLFGKSLSQEQIFLLDDLSDRYKRKILMLDRDAELDMISKREKLAYLGFETVRLPHSIDDPALLTPSDLFRILR